MVLEPTAPSWGRPPAASRKWLREAWEGPGPSLSLLAASPVAVWPPVHSPASLLRDPHPQLLGSALHPAAVGPVSQEGLGGAPREGAARGWGGRSSWGPRASLPAPSTAFGPQFFLQIPGPRFGEGAVPTEQPQGCLWSPAPSWCRQMDRTSCPWRGLGVELALAQGRGPWGRGCHCPSPWLPQAGWSCVPEQAHCPPLLAGPGLLSVRFSAWPVWGLTRNQGGLGAHEPRWAGKVGVGLGAHPLPRQPCRRGPGRLALLLGRRELGPRGWLPGGGAHPPLCDPCALHGLPLTLVGGPPIPQGASTAPSAPPPCLWGPGAPPQFPGSNPHSRPLFEGLEGCTGRWWGTLTSAASGPDQRPPPQLIMPPNLLSCPAPPLPLPQHPPIPPPNAGFAVLRAGGCW